MKRKVIVLIAAMETELRFFQSTWRAAHKSMIGNMEIFEMDYGANLKIVWLWSGVGKTNMALAMGLLGMWSSLKEDNISLCLHMGVGGALSEGVCLEEEVWGMEVAHGDVDVCAFGYAFGQVPKMPALFEVDGEVKKEIHFFLEQNQAQLKDQEVSSEVLLKRDRLKQHKGLIVSVDRFISKKAEKKLLLEKFPKALSLDMESSSFAQSAFRLKIPWLIFRVISDGANQEAKKDYGRLLEKLQKKIYDQVIAFLDFLDTRSMESVKEES